MTKQDQAFLKSIITSLSLTLGAMSSTTADSVVRDCVNTMNDYFDL